MRRMQAAQREKGLAEHRSAVNAIWQIDDDNLPPWADKTLLFEPTNLELIQALQRCQEDIGLLKKEAEIKTHMITVYRTQLQNVANSRRHQLQEMLPDCSDKWTQCVLHHDLLMGSSQDKGDGCWEFSRKLLDRGVQCHVCKSNSSTQTSVMTVHARQCQTITRCMENREAQTEEQRVPEPPAREDDVKGAQIKKRIFVKSKQTQTSSVSRERGMQTDQPHAKHKQVQVTIDNGVERRVSELRRDIDARNNLVNKMTTSIQKDQQQMKKLQEQLREATEARQKLHAQLQAANKQATFRVPLHTTDREVQTESANGGDQPGSLMTEQDVTDLLRWQMSQTEINLTQEKEATKRLHRLNAELRHTMQQQAKDLRSVQEMAANLARVCGLQAAARCGTAACLQRGIAYLNVLHTLVPSQAQSKAATIAGNYSTQQITPEPEHPAHAMSPKQTQEKPKDERRNTEVSHILLPQTSPPTDMYELAKQGKTGKRQHLLKGKEQGQNINLGQQQQKTNEDSTTKAAPSTGSVKSEDNVTQQLNYDIKALESRMAQLQIQAQHLTSKSGKWYQTPPDMSTGQCDLQNVLTAQFLENQMGTETQKQGATLIDPNQSRGETLVDDIGISQAPYINNVATAKATKIRSPDYMANKTSDTAHHSGFLQSAVHTSKGNKANTRNADNSKSADDLYNDISNDKVTNVKPANNSLLPRENSPAITSSRINRNDPPRNTKIVASQRKNTMKACPSHYSANSQTSVPSVQMESSSYVVANNKVGTHPCHQVLQNDGKSVVSFTGVSDPAGKLVTSPTNRGRGNTSSNRRKVRAAQRIAANRAAQAIRPESKTSSFTTTPTQTQTNRENTNLSQGGPMDLNNQSNPTASNSFCPTKQASVLMPVETMPTTYSTLQGKSGPTTIVTPTIAAKLPQTSDSVRDGPASSHVQLFRWDSGRFGMTIKAENQVSSTCTSSMNRTSLSDSTPGILSNQSTVSTIQSRNTLNASQTSPVSPPGMIYTHSQLAHLAQLQSRSTYPPNQMHASSPNNPSVQLNSHDQTNIVRNQLPPAPSVTHVHSVSPVQRGTSSQASVVPDCSPQQTSLSQSCASNQIPLFQCRAQSQASLPQSPSMIHPSLMQIRLPSQSARPQTSLSGHMPLNPVQGNVVTNVHHLHVGSTPSRRSPCGPTAPAMTPSSGKFSFWSIFGMGNKK